MTTKPGVADSPVPEQQPLPIIRPRPATQIRRWLALGTGVGIEIRDGELRASIVRVRPSEAGVTGAVTVTDFRTRPAAEWGADLSAFLKKIGAGHIAATVLLPRHEVIVRQVYLPGVSDADLGPAIQLQMDSLHPFTDDDVYFSWGRLGKSGHILVGIARREVVEGYSTLFAEAGIKVAAFTFAAGALYSAVRLLTEPVAEFLAAREGRGAVEVYGESAARTLYAASLPVEYDRAVSIARSELRLDPQSPVHPFADLLPKPALFPESHDPKTPEFEDWALSYVTALAGACPRLGIEANLLPAERRRTSSRTRLIPTAVLGLTLASLVTALALHSRFADARYLGILQVEISKYEPRALRVNTIDKAIVSARARTQRLEEFRRRAKLDMDTLREITKLVPPPGWVSNLDMDRNTLQLAGEAEQAEPLLSMFDKSPLFDRTEFTMPISRAQSGESFRIKTTRVDPPLVPPAPPAAAAPAPTPPPQQSPAAPAKQEGGVK